MQMYKEAWQQALSDLITDTAELFSALKLNESELPEALLAARDFQLKIPRKMLSRIEKGNPYDPVLWQFLPHALELQKVAGYSDDPLQESDSNPLPGLLHKYQSRVLITLTSACAVHCRYCFRRAFPYEENNPGKKGLEKIVNYLANHAEINEVILSGGDPLTVSDQLLYFLSEKLRGLPHIKRLRIHSRLPIVLPERITEGFLAWIDSLSIPLVMVLHANHPNEIDNEVVVALQRLNKLNVTLLNQTVLLKNINDNANVLRDLSEKLFAAKVLPYYLHVLDKVAGTAHFDVSLDKARSLHVELQSLLPGFLVPRLTQEIPGQLSKTWL